MSWFSTCIANNRRPISSHSTITITIYIIIIIAISIPSEIIIITAIITRSMIYYAAGSIVTCHFLSKLGIHIDRPSTTSMVNVNGEKKMPMGEVLNFPITVQEIEVPINVVVTEAETYSVIVG